MLYPPEAVDYVVVHELAHIKEKEPFGKVLRPRGKVYADYREREKLLKKQPSFDLQGFGILILH